MAGFGCWVFLFLVPDPKCGHDVDNLPYKYSYIYIYVYTTCILQLAVLTEGNPKP